VGALGAPTATGCQIVPKPGFDGIVRRSSATEFMPRAHACAVLILSFIFLQPTSLLWAHSVRPLSPQITWFDGKGIQIRSAHVIGCFVIFLQPTL
jgi:hypothetical protein